MSNSYIQISLILFLKVLLTTGFFLLLYTTTYYSLYYLCICNILSDVKQLHINLFCVNIYKLNILNFSLNLLKQYLALSFSSSGCFYLLLLRNLSIWLNSSLRLNYPTLRLWKHLFNLINALVLLLFIGSRRSPRLLILS